MARILGPVLLVVSVVLAGCARTSPGSAGAAGSGPGSAAAPGAASNLVLYVSNQSFADDAVDLLVAVSGEVVVDRRFLVENQHTWVEYPLSLPAGRHTVEATSGTGATLTESFELPESGTRWAVLSYWYDAAGTPRSFTFTIHDQPVGFD